jgi:hypothetical protein
LANHRPPSGVSPGWKGRVKRLHPRLQESSPGERDTVSGNPRDVVLARHSRRHPSPRFRLYRRRTTAREDLGWGSAGAYAALGIRTGRQRSGSRWTPSSPRPAERWPGLVVRQNPLRRLLAWVRRARVQQHGVPETPGLSLTVAAEREAGGALAQAVAGRETRVIPHESLIQTSSQGSTLSPRRGCPQAARRS